MAIDPSPFGINVHQSPRALEIFAAVGVRWHRIDINWDEIESKEAQPSWDYLDALCSSSEKLGVSLLGSIAYTPSWASGTPNRAAPPQDIGEFARFAAEVATRYRGRIHALSVWNEPDLKQFWDGSRERYLGLLVAGLRAIRSAAPGIVRCGPDLSGWSGKSKGKEWFAAALAATDADPEGPLLDVITHHQYGAGDSPKGRIEEIERLFTFLRSNDHHGRPVWLTEIGWDTGKVPSEAHRSSHLRAVLAGMQQRSSWWRKTFWYDSHGLVDGKGPARWGLMIGPETDPRFGEALGAFEAYAEVIRGSANNAPGHPAGPVPAITEEGALVILNAAYRGVLGRPVDAAGFKAHLGLVMDDGILDLCRGLFASAEFTARSLGAADLTRQLYRGILAREPDSAGESITRVAIQVGRGAERTAQMLESDEFRKLVSLTL